MVGRPSTFSGTTRRDSEFDAVNIPPPPLETAFVGLVGSVITFNAVEVDADDDDDKDAEREPKRLGLFAGCHL